nr:UvrD-like helicase, ATP-binding domain, P-loop containing nucleoside triphosphate hydrolase [Tanacetum cinerariifolium]
MKRNFRTHAGVLDLAQSVIDILYCYFVHSIDNLEPETSIISRETHVFLESYNNENAIVTIFGGSKSGGEIVGFGAEQVILVRDDRARTEIIEYVGRQALVLTILECKGLEFQGVLLYNFFGTSPLKDQWRVIYRYMKKHNWLDEKLPQSFLPFDEARHSLLCSELKQLGLVQIRKLDDSVAEAMRVASSPHEWRERGKKLFYENNFVMAMLCFERAGEETWLKLAKACGLRASADQIRGTHPESYFGYLREAADLFESIGKLDSAASCYYDLREYERAEVDQELLENCALGYHELLLLKEESGHFLENAELASSLWGDGNISWPLKQFAQKEEIYILRSVESLEKEEPFKVSLHVDFCLYYFRVRKQFLKGNTVYLSLNKDADWIRNTCNKGLQGTRSVYVLMAGRWCLLFGLIGSPNYFLWTGAKSVDEDLVSIRETDISVNLLEEIILQTVDIKALERVIIICLCSRVSVALYKNLINKLKLKSRWKSFVKEFRDCGLKDVSVARALQHALDSSFGATFSFLSLHSFGYLLDRLLLMHSFSLRKSYTTRSSFVGSFTHIQSALTLSVGQSSLNLSVMIERIKDILSCGEFGIGMIQRSKIDGSYYPLLVLKMVMILSLICLKLPNYSHRLLQHMSGYGNYAYFLPKKFVSCLLRKSKNPELNLNPEVVAEAFFSVDDPLLIISSEDGSPKINAPCAIFVDLRNSKEEIMSVVFPRKNTHNVPTSLNTINGGAIPEGSSSETLPDLNMNCAEMNWKVIEEISEAINEKKGMASYLLQLGLCATFLLAAVARSSCSSMEFQKFEIFVFLVNEGLKMLSFAFDTRARLRMMKKKKKKKKKKVDHVGVSRDAVGIIWELVSFGLFVILGVRHAIDKYYNYLNDYVLNQVIKVEETCDEASAVLENRRNLTALRMSQVEDDEEEEEEEEKEKKRLIMWVYQEV